MAQAKPEVNKSQIIREFVVKNPTLSVSEVATMLGERGVEVSRNLVYKVKILMQAKKHKEKRQKAAAAAVVATAASSDGAAKAPSKSSAVRAVLKGNRKMMAKDVVSALAEKGISVTEGLVYFVKGQLEGKKDSKKKAQKEVAQVAAIAVATAPTAPANVDAVKTIMMVKGFAAQVGGMKKLAALVQALSE